MATLTLLFQIRLEASDPIPNADAKALREELRAALEEALYERLNAVGPVVDSAEVAAG